MATINYEFYNGSDSYSDGNIENTLMDMAEKGIGIEDLEDDKLSYPVLYHFSHLRENIINWYPIEADQTVLEIGSGCGAITNALCQKAKRVVAVELSKRRALINYTRNKDKSNLEIVIGNFNDIVFTEKFDYVVLNGVFEYALSFIDGEEPYIKFLELCKKNVKDSGKILIAIENRLGLKYFTGAPEDHTQNYLLGINEYKGNESVRTYSKTEWELILEKCGLSCKFYYPYPDYKFPEEIYTDSSLKTGMYGKPYFNYNPMRFEWINEHLLTKTLREESVISTFANSFFIEIAADKQFSNIEYCKMSCDRRCDRRIITLIRNDTDKKWVEKIAAHSSAKSHIQNLIKNSQNFENKKVICLTGKMENGKAVFEYLYETNLEQQIISKLEKIDKITVFQMLEDFFHTYFEQFEQKEFIQDAEFTKVFGQFDRKKSYIGISGGNIDLVLDNIYKIQNQYCVIDCEWIFDFSIPVKFIIWRSLNDFCYKCAETQKVFKQKELFDYFCIDEEDIFLFRQWNAYFAYDWLMANGTEKFSKPGNIVSMDYLIELYKKEHYLQCSLYYDCGEGYSEEQKIFAEVAIKKNRFLVIFDLSEIRNIKKLRFDPVEKRSCRCKLDNEYLKFVPVNAYIQKDGWDVFMTIDPIYEVKLEYELERKCISISGEIQFIDFDIWYQKISCFYEHQFHELEIQKRYCEQIKIESHHMQEELQANLEHVQNLLQLSKEREKQLVEREDHLNETLESIYNSKGWKMLDFAKKLVKKNKGK